MKRRIAYVLIVLGLMVGLAALVVKGLQEQALSQRLNIEAQTYVDINQGATPTGMFAKLEAQGVIKHSFWLRVYWRLNHKGDKIHTGEYCLSLEWICVTCLRNGLLVMWLNTASH